MTGTVHRELAPARVWPGVVTGVLAFVVGAGGAVLTWWVFVTTGTGQRVEEAAFAGALYGRTGMWRLAEPVLEVVSVPFLVAVLVAAVVAAAVQRRWALAVHAGLLLGGANLTTQVLKHGLLTRPDFGLGTTNTLPSGHTTVAASVSATALLVVPPRARPWAALGGVAYTAGTGVSTLVGRWHRPSDVVAGILVVLAWVGVVAVLAAVGRRGLMADPLPRLRPTLIGVGTVLGVGAAGMGAAASIMLSTTWERVDGISDAREVVAYGGGALGVGAVAFAAFGLMLLAIHLATGPARFRPELGGGSAWGDRGA